MTRMIGGRWKRQRLSGDGSKLGGEFAFGERVLCFSLSLEALC